MSGNIRSVIWSIICTLLLLAGEAAAFFFAWREGIWIAVVELACFVLGWIVAPIVHEWGHIYFAKRQNMQIAYAKFACFKIVERKGKNRLRLASPLATDETQITPLSGGNMRARACRCTIGGLVFSGVYLCLVTLAASLLTAFVQGYAAYAVWGLLPYGGYLFLLNVMPCVYSNGKTDMLVYRGLKKGGGAEENMVAAMEIQGQLFEGKRYSDIEEKWFFDLPQLAEDEPLYAIMLDLRYRYWLDKNEIERAADCINRLVISQPYLRDEQLERVAAELMYMHALKGDKERAEGCLQAGQGYLHAETVAAKRIVAAVACLLGEQERARELKAQAEALLKNERTAGERLLEEALLSRLPLV